MTRKRLWATSSPTYAPRCRASRSCVYDNCSTDRTAEVAAAAGAEVRTEPVRGKGNVIRRALADIDADVYVMIDGDDTYDASATPEMVRVLLSGPYDQVTGVRVTRDKGAYRSGHELGNRMFNGRRLPSSSGYPVNDMLSGYRVFSRRFVKSFPAVSRAFEIETELTVHAINNRVPQAEVPVGFKDRAAGSASKLRTYHDGFRIARMITRLLHHERPLALYSTIAALTALVALGTRHPCHQRSTCRPAWWAASPPPSSRRRSSSSPSSCSSSASSSTACGRCARRRPGSPTWPSLPHRAEWWHPRLARMPRHRRAEARRWEARRPPRHRSRIGRRSGFERQCRRRRPRRRAVARRLPRGRSSLSSVPATMWCSSTMASRACPRWPGCAW